MVLVLLAVGGILAAATKLVKVAADPSFFISYAIIQVVVFVLLIWFLDLYEREPLPVVALLVLWGGTVACFLALVGNEFVSSQLPPRVERVFGAAISAPLVEETSKGLALLIVFAASGWLAQRFGLIEFEGVTDGLVYGAAVGMGFAFTEDIFYFFQFESLEVLLTRVDFFGLNMLGHSVYTGLFGAALGLATWSRSRGARIGCPLLGLGAGALGHALHNGFAELVLVLKYGFANTAAALPGGGGVPEALGRRMEATYESASRVSDLIGYLFVAAFFLAIVVWLRYQRRIISYELAEEAESGLGTAEECDAVPRYWFRLRCYWGLLRTGQLDRWRAVRRVNDELVNLAFLKWRIRTVGGDPGQVERQRQRVSMARAGQ